MMPLKQLETSLFRTSAVTVARGWAEAVDAVLPTLTPVEGVPTEAHESRLLEMESVPKPKSTPIEAVTVELVTVAALPPPKAPALPSAIPGAEVLVLVFRTFEFKT